MKAVTEYRPPSSSCRQAWCHRISSFLSLDKTKVWSYSKPPKCVVIWSQNKESFAKYCHKGRWY